jgi:hypothetical protein
MEARHRATDGGDGHEALPILATQLCRLIRGAEDGVAISG